MSDSNRTICKRCREIKNRVHAGNFANGDKRYVDDAGKMWTGRTCPECVVELSRERMRKKRTKKGDTSAEETES